MSAMSLCAMTTTELDLRLGVLRTGGVSILVLCKASPVNLTSHHWPSAVAGVGLSPPFVCFFPHDISKTDAARVTKPGIQIFHDEAWKPIILGSKCRRLRSQITKKALPAWVFVLYECWLHRQNRLLIFYRATLC